MSYRFDFGRLSELQKGLTGMTCSCKSNGMGLHMGKRPHSLTFTVVTLLGMTLVSSVLTWFLFRPCKLKIMPTEEKAEV